MTDTAPPLAYGEDEPVVQLDPVHGGFVRMVRGVPYVPFISEACLDAMQASFTPLPSDVFIVTR